MSPGRWKVQIPALVLEEDNELLIQDRKLMRSILKSDEVTGMRGEWHFPFKTSADVFFLLSNLEQTLLKGRKPQTSNWPHFNVLQPFYTKVSGQKQ